MESNNQVKLKFKGVDIYRVNFFSTERFEDEDELKVKIEPKVFYPEDDNQKFKIIMEVKLTCQESFDFALTAFGNFEFTAALDNESDRDKFVNANAVAIMFPYVRSFISTFTSNIGGASVTITLPARFFKGELEVLRPQSTELDYERNQVD